VCVVEMGEGTFAVSGSLLLVIPPVPDPITVSTHKDAITMRRTVFAPRSAAKSTVLDESIVMDFTSLKFAPVPMPSTAP